MNGRSVDTVIVDDWITTRDAADILEVDARTVLKKCCRDQTVRNIIVPVENSRGNVGGKRLWWRRDVEDLAWIKNNASLSINSALRVMAAQRPRPGSRLNDGNETENEAQDDEAEEGFDDDAWPQ